MWSLGLGLGLGVRSTCAALCCRQIHCSDSKPTTRRGFGSNKGESGSKDKALAPQQSSLSSSQAPRLSSPLDGNKSRNINFDADFEERLQAVTRSALEQKKAAKEKEFGAIDYDAPVSSDQKTIGTATKIGVGVAVVLFGLVFAFGDFLPSSSDSPNEDNAVVSSKLSEEDKATLQIHNSELACIIEIRKIAMDKSSKMRVKGKFSIIDNKKYADYRMTMEGLSTIPRARLSKQITISQKISPLS